jgi:hypothetical protein
MNVRRWLTTSVLVSTPASVNVHGERGYGSAERWPARVEWTPAVEDDGTSERGTVTATIITELAIPPRSRVWLPALDMTPPPDSAASDTTKAIVSDACSTGVTVSGRVSHYETRL